MSNLLDGHLVGFEAMTDLEEAQPGCFETEYTDIYGEELVKPRINDGGDTYDQEVEKRQHRRPRKIKSCRFSPIFFRPPTHTR